MQGELISLLDRGPDPLILPEFLDGIEVVGREWLFGADFEFGQDVSHVFLYGQSRLAGKPRDSNIGDCWPIAPLASYTARALGKVAKCTCLVILVLELDVKLGHGVEDESERLDDVGKDDGLPFQLFGLAEALCVNQLHLLKDGRLSRFTGTYSNRG